MQAYRAQGDVGPSGVVTSEAVTLAFQTAGIGTRTMARLIDALVLMVLVFATGVAVAALDAWTIITWLQVIVTILLYGLVVLGYPILMETFASGRTLGKMAMGIRVVTRSGGRPTLRHTAIRAIIAIPEILISLGLIALVVMFSTASNQRLGDLVAGTIVVRDRVGGGRAEATNFSVNPRWHAYVDQLDVSRIRSSEYALVRSGILRAEQMRHDASVAAAVNVADSIRPLVTPAPPVGMDALTWLRCVAVAVQRRTARTAARAATTATPTTTASRATSTTVRDATPQVRLSATAPSPDRRADADVHGLRPPG